MALGLGLHIPFKGLLRQSCASALRDWRDLLLCPVMLGLIEPSSAAEQTSRPSASPGGLLLARLSILACTLHSKSIH